LTREEIIPYVQNIVASCPGKSEGELWGWVDKALNGELTEYNKS
jgi:hypothetical protein